MEVMSRRNEPGDDDALVIGRRIEDGAVAVEAGPVEDEEAETLREVGFEGMTREISFDFNGDLWGSVSFSEP